MNYLNCVKTGDIARARAKRVRPVGHEYELDAICYRLPSPGLDRVLDSLVRVRDQNDRQVRQISGNILHVVRYLLVDHAAGVIGRFMRMHGRNRPSGNGTWISPTATNPKALYNGSPGRVAASSKERKPRSRASVSHLSNRRRANPFRVHSG